MHEFYDPWALEARRLRAAPRPEAPRLCIVAQMLAPTDVLSASQLVPCVVGDALARYFRMRGHEVLRPVCWDVLGGLPERIARDEGTTPERRTARLIVSFAAALKALGCEHDEDQSIDPSQPEHYRWTQWLFLRLRELGLIRRRLRQTEAGPRAEWVLAEERVIGEPHAWGTPIPIVYCAPCDGSAQGLAVPFEHLPVRRPEGGVWGAVSCPRCGGAARREAEVMAPEMDALVASVRCLSLRSDTALVDPEQARRWLPRSVFVGDGPELLELGVLHRLGLVSGKEPFARRVPSGGVHIVRSPLAPAAVLERYGADTLRLMLLASREGHALCLTEERARECSRVLERLWRLVWRHRDTRADTREDLLPPGPLEGRAGALRVAAHRCLKRIGEALEALRVSEGLTAVRELVRTLEAVERVDSPLEEAVMAEALGGLCGVLAPFAPHLAGALAEARGFQAGQLALDWPAYDPAVLGETTRYPVQVNGRRVCWVHVPVGAAEADVRAVAEADPAVRRHVEGHRVRRCIFVPGRAVSFVVE